MAILCSVDNGVCDGECKEKYRYGICSEAYDSNWKPKENPADIIINEDKERYNRRKRSK